MATEYGWLVENGKQGDELRYRTWRDGMPAWTADHDEATRYCRRIDAERAHQEDEDAQRIVEHAWDNITANVELSGERSESASTKGYAQPAEHKEMLASLRRSQNINREVIIEAIRLGIDPRPIQQSIDLAEEVIDYFETFAS